MRRRDCLLLTVGCLLRPKIYAESLSGSYYRNYCDCLPNYLSSLARAAYDRRNSALGRLTTPEAIRERQRWVRATFWRLVGGEPERTPLKARVTGHFERPGYRLEKVIYESRPGIVVSANLYVPTAGQGPYPGVLFQMGHYYAGKGYATYQKCCQGLARLGYVVLAFDPMGQGERIAYPDSSGINTRFASVDEEHNVPGKQLLLLGDSASRYQAWDAIRSLDYLAEHPAVDPTRLGSTGQSGGGTLTMLLACVDDRLRAAVVSSGNTEDLACADFNPPGSTDDAEQDLIGSGPVGFDRWDLLYPIAPKPLLVQVSAHDFFGTYSPRYLEDGEEQYRRLLKTYEVLGHADHLGWRSTPLTHALNYDFRLNTYNWFEKWLKQSDRRIDQEPPVAPEPENAVWTGPTGSVVRDYGSLRPFDLIKGAAAGVRRGSTASTIWIEALGVTLPSQDLAFRKLATATLDGIQILAMEVNTAPGVWAPTWLFVPDKPADRQNALVVLDDRGRNAQAHEDGLYHRLARTGRFLCVADVRGTGDMRSEVGRGNPEYTIRHDSDEDYAWSSLILGKPLLGQRITDILALVEATRKATNRDVSIAAKGRLTTPALFAFAADRKIASLYLAGGLVSFQNLLETEIYKESFANFSWNLFRMTDLPVLAAECAPRRIHLAGTVDAANGPLSETEVRRAYSGNHVTISIEGVWDARNLEAA